MAFNMILNDPQAVLYYELQSHRKLKLGWINRLTVLARFGPHSITVSRRASKESLPLPYIKVSIVPVCIGVSTRDHRAILLIAPFDKFTYHVATSQFEERSAVH